MSTLPTRSPALASLLLCLALSSTACTPALQVKPSHAVEVVRYEEKPLPEALTRPLPRCTLPPAPTWADVWSWGLCSDGQVMLADCRLDRIAGRGSQDCDALLGRKLAGPSDEVPPRG